MIIIEKLRYNWNSTLENGEDYCEVIVGKRGVSNITYHKPEENDDKHYCDIYREDKIIRVFNINEVTFIKSTKA